MTDTNRVLKTREGEIRFPCFIPVTTFGEKYPLDRLVRPYLPRLAQAIMVSPHYAKNLEGKPQIPLFLDSGGFASLFSNARVVNDEYNSNLGCIEIQGEERIETIRPQYVLQFQEEIASVGFTLDFPITSRMDPSEAERRQELTIANALWAIENRRRRDLILYASVQGTDVASFRQCARAYRNAGFDGLAIGGLVPRARDHKAVLEIVEAVREETPLPLHAFGIGQPDLLEKLFKAGVDSADSSAYLKMAAEGKLWSDTAFRLPDPTPTERLHLALLNLTYASGRSLPLSAARLTFGTPSIEAIKNGRRG